MASILAKDIIELCGIWKTMFAEHREELIELDSRIGDGDLGIYMADGMSKAFQATVTMQENTPGEVLRKIGTTFAVEAPSTMGTLIAVAFMDAGKAFRQQKEMSEQDFFEALECMANGIVRRGGAKEGDKTILDVMLPANRAGAAAELPFATRCKGMFEQAVCSEIASRELKAVHGRPGYFGDATIGKIDGGCVVGKLLYQAIAEWAEGKK